MKHYQRRHRNEQHYQNKQTNEKNITKQKQGELVV